MSVSFGILVGFIAWFVVRYLLAGLYTVDQNERAVKTVLRPGAAARRRDDARRSDRARRCGRMSGSATLPAGAGHSAGRAVFQVAVGAGPQGLDRHADGEHGVRPRGRRRPTTAARMLEAVTKDQLNIGLTGQIRYRVSERNLYAYLFGVKNPIAHVMGYFVSVLRERIANFEAPHGDQPAREPADRCDARERHLDQRPAQEPARPQRAHGPASAGRRRRATAWCSMPRSSPGSIRRRRSSRRWRRSTPRTTRCRRTSAWPRPAPTRRSCSRGARWRSRRCKAQAEVEPLRAPGRRSSPSSKRSGPRGAAGVRAQRPARPASTRRSDVIRGGRAMIDARWIPARPRSSPSSCCSCWCRSLLFCVRGLRALRDRPRAHVPRLRALRQGARHDRRAGPALPAVQARARRRSSSTGSASATCSTCGSTRSTCAASR